MKKTDTPRRGMFFERPHWNRRQFIHWAGAGIGASTLAGRVRAGEVTGNAGVVTQNKAKQVVFVLLTGAISQIDTFDFKPTVDTPLSLLKPETINGIVWPTGILPNLASNLPDICIARSVRSRALQHTLAQTWAQIGRNPTAALGDIAPNIGSIVAVEKEPLRQPNQVLPAFLALNAGSAIGSGYLSAAYGPMKTDAVATGLANTSNPDGEARFDRKYSLLTELDASLRASTANGNQFTDFGKFYDSAKGLMYNPAVNDAFQFTTTESQRYGASSFGNACLVANKVLLANSGTRFIQIILGGWDHHQDIYTDLPPLAKQLDGGLSALLTDLKNNGLLNETLVVVQGEFGRTPGALTPQGGRDHYSQQFVAFAGAGIRGGRALGATDAEGGTTAEFGWARERDISPEDVEATIYSALGIDWTTIRYDDPFGRGFEYTPFSKDDRYGPINELWS